jgi:hypothetical protein
MKTLCVVAISGSGMGGGLANDARSLAVRLSFRLIGSTNRLQSLAGSRWSRAAYHPLTLLSDEHLTYRDKANFAD